MKNRPRPPKLAVKFFTIICGEAFVEDLLGDLDELFSKHEASKGRFKASIIYWWHVLTLSFSYAVRKRKNDATLSVHFHRNRFDMLGNYLKISFRNIKKQRLFTGLNIVGLAMGMSVTLLALAMFMDLYSFDRFHANSDSMYRVITSVQGVSGTDHYASTPAAVCKIVKEDFPQVSKSVRINKGLRPVITVNDQQIQLHGYFTEPAFFELLTFPLAQGDARTALAQPNTAVITQEVAQRLFKDKDPMGEILQTKKGPLLITGVLEKIPKNTHMKFEILSSLSTSKKLSSTGMTHQDWTGFKGNYLYFQLDNDSERDQVLTQIKAAAITGNTFFEKENLKADFDIQAFSNITLGRSLYDEIGISFDLPVMMLFFFISLLILIPACFNYVNLSVAQALKRSHEIGIRKLLGGQKRQIIDQFLIETILLTTAAVLLATYIFTLIRKEFLAMIIGSESLSLKITPSILIVFLVFAILTALLTGFFPATYFAKISPINALKSETGPVTISGIKKTLITAQLSLTLIFMIGIGVLLKQYKHTLTYDHGFAKENIVVIPVSGKNVPVIRNEFIAHPDVSKISFTSNLPGTPSSYRTMVSFPDRRDSTEIHQSFIDESFIGQLKLDLIWGGDFSPDDPNVLEEYVLVNEAFMEKMRLMKPSDSLQYLIEGQKKVKIIGVVKDYNFQPLNQEIAPLMLRKGNKTFEYALLTVSSHDIFSTITELENRWELLYPSEPIRTTFLKTEIEAAYDYMQVVIKIFGFLGFLAISISCLGLLGMVVYTTEGRTREIAIRKVLGANTVTLYRTLAASFFKMLVIASIISIPISYFFYDKLYVRLLNKYSEGVGWMEVLVSVLITLLLSGSAIIWQTRKIVNLNPAVNLKQE